MDDDYVKRVAARIRRTMERIGVTQAELARRLGVSDKQVNRWVNGHVMPNRRSMNALERALGVPAETFLRDDDEEPEAA